MKVLWRLFEWPLKLLAAIILTWALITVAVEVAHSQPDSIPRYGPPVDSILIYVQPIKGDIPAFLSGRSLEQRRAMGVVLTLQDGPTWVIPQIYANASFPPDNPGWPDLFGRRGYTLPEGMPDLYYQCVDWITTGTFEGHLHEEQAWGSWHFDSYWPFVPDSITWDCCPPSLWPHPAGCVRQLDRWYRDPDTGYWSHWWWQIRWNSAVGGYWEIVGGIPGGGFWSPHLGPWIQSQVGGGDQ